MFVGTKRSASKTIKEEASSIGLPYVDKRWLGGTLTNWKTIRGSIRRLLDIEEMISSGRIEKLIKKEAVEIQKEYTKLQAYAREQALERLIADADKLNADAILGIRFTTSVIAQGTSEILAYGTAVKLKQ